MKLALRQRALRLLSKREYGFTELVNKLKPHAEASDQDKQPRDNLLQVVEQLRDEGLQSDARFAESYVYQRMRKGFGPVRIRQELQDRQISNSLIDSYLAMDQSQWQEQAARVREKKYGQAIPASDQDRAKQATFLQYRGFSEDHINQLFKSDEI